MNLSVTFWQRAVGLLLCLSIGLSSVQAQMKVGQPSGPPDSSAALDVSGGPYSFGSQYRGIAPPKVALVQTASAAPVEKPVVGLLVYNTARVGGLTPGYYYWEGSRWVRFVTASGTGSARTALNPGDPIPAYTLSQLRALTTTPDYVILIEPGREGLFHYDASDTSTLDNTGIVLVTATGKRYKRVIDGTAVNVIWFGARGDLALPVDSISIPEDKKPAITANTAAIQAAINFICTVNSGSVSGIYPVSKGQSNRLYFPAGTYYVDAPLNISGTLTMYGDGGLQNGGTVIANRSNGSNVFEITGSQFAENCALQVSEMRFRGYWGGGAIVYAGATGSLNSLYFNRCWFQFWAESNYALKILKSDDLQIVDCTFDVGVGGGFLLGEASNPDHTVMNCTISGNTFYHVSKLGQLNNVDGFLFTSNRCYKALNKPNTPVGIDALSSSSGGKVKGVVISNNSFTGINNVYCDRFGGVVFTNNAIQQSTGVVYNFGGGANGVVIKNNVITDNVITGVWNTTALLNNAPNTPLAPFLAYGPVCLTNNTIRDNKIIDESNSSITAFWLSDSRTTGNTFENTIMGFSAPVTIPNPNQNLSYPLSGDLKESFVQGLANTRSTPINSITAVQKSGFYSLDLSNNSDIVKVAERSRLPFDASGFNAWHVTIARFENGVTVGEEGAWEYITIVNLKSGLAYYTTRNGQTGNLADWKPMTSTDLTKLSNGTANAPALAFNSTPTTGVYRGTSNGEFTVQGPVGTATGSTMTLTSLGRTDFNINANSASDLSVLNWSQGGSSKWTAYVDGTQSWNLLRQNGSTPISISSAGNVTLNGNTTLSGNTALTGKATMSTATVSNLTVTSGLTLPTAVSATTVSTAAWTVGNYNEIVAPNMLEIGGTYLLKLQWGKTNVDNFTQIYLITIMSSIPGTSSGADIIPIDVASYGNTNYRIRIRRKVPTVANVSYGLEATISSSAMAVPDANFVFSLTKY